MTEPTDELKPCPFCDGEDRLRFEVGGLGRAWVVCERCDAEGPGGDDKQDAAALWNTRTTDTRADDVVGELREALADARLALASVMTDEYDAFYVKVRAALERANAALSRAALAEQETAK